jgi:hypothetical protein
MMYGRSRLPIVMLLSILGVTAAVVKAETQERTTSITGSASLTRSRNGISASGSVTSSPDKPSTKKTQPDNASSRMARQRMNQFLRSRIDVLRKVDALRRWQAAAAANGENQQKSQPRSAR